jgi:hypothetical protein
MGGAGLPAMRTLRLADGRRELASGGAPLDAAGVGALAAAAAASRVRHLGTRAAYEAFAAGAARRAAGAYVLLTAGLGGWCPPCNAADAPYARASAALADAAAVGCARVQCDGSAELRALCEGLGATGVPALFLLPRAPTAAAAPLPRPVEYGGLHAPAAALAFALAADSLLAFAAAAAAPAHALVALGGAEGVWAQLVRPSTRARPGGGCHDWAPLSCAMRGAAACAADGAAAAECASTCKLCATGRPTVRARARARPARAVHSLRALTLPLLLCVACALRVGFCSSTQASPAASRAR